MVYVMTNYDDVNNEIEKLKNLKLNSNWRIYLLMVILVRLLAKILDRMEGEK
jgi:hypothetical protein